MIHHGFTSRWLSWLFIYLKGNLDEHVWEQTKPHYSLQTSEMAINEVSVNVAATSGCM